MTLHHTSVQLLSAAFVAVLADATACAGSCPPRDSQYYSIDPVTVIDQRLNEEASLSLTVLPSMLPVTNGVRIRGSEIVTLRAYTPPKVFQDTADDIAWLRAITKDSQVLRATMNPEVIGNIVRTFTGNFRHLEGLAKVGLTTDDTTFVFSAPRLGCIVTWGSANDAVSTRLIAITWELIKYPKLRTAEERLAAQKNINEAVNAIERK